MNRPVAVWITDRVSTCETHPAESAIGACARCGRFICRDCNRGQRDGRLTCPICASVARSGSPSRQLAVPPAPTSLAVHPLMPAPLPPNPFPARPEPTRAQRLMWLPIAGGVWTLILAASASWLAIVAAIPIGIASIYGAYTLQKRHRHEQLEQRALTFFRALRRDAVTKDEAVKDHGLDPRQADQVLKWLVGQDLLVADWDDLDRPVVYRRQRG